MKKRIFGGAVILALGIAVFGMPPFSGQPTPGFAEGEPGFETGVKRLPNGIYEVSALTPMPGVSAEMVGWWFSDYLQTTEHYKRWFPDAHVWMDWENKVPGELIGASHLVHEYIGEDLAKLRIQFVEPEEILGKVDLADDDVAVCARVGLLEEPLYAGEMCHIIRNVEGGAEMRSRFWLGMVASREGNEAVPSIIGTVGNTYLARVVTVKETAALALMDHCFDEMTILAGFLPEIYAER
ncbi:DAPG hydrolase family protein [Yoonia sp. I 8.24]|uniref:DAPG hydrolase family protein n=1 Tax=Yoonia sp. I 8.24 TaxID=1537229 RepID=UPI001EE1313C|nr:hypothetical protein [Yoonia sp. I 8.24]MCG3269529.1 hypothetical protein [Yoonia sp. I 8.24]